MDEKKAIEILKKHSTSEKDLKAVLEHSKALQKLALEVAQKIMQRNKDISIDLDFIRTACILHDIGRFKHPPGTESVKHGVAGADMLRKEGLDERYARVCERHLGAGVTAEDVKEKDLPIPAADYIPQTIEERIIAYADNLMSGEKPKDSGTVVKRFTEELGHKIGQRVRKLHDEIEELMKK